MQERRKYIRYAIEGSAVLTTEEDTARSINGDLINIGFQGMSLNLLEKIREGIRVKFALITKLHDKSIIGEGKVKYVHEITRYGTNVFRLGIEFTNIDNEAIRSIINRIQEDLCAEARRKRTG